MKQIIAMHGWSGNSSIWNQWKELFEKKGWLWQSGDRGYCLNKSFNPKWLNDKKSKDEKTSSRTIIAHSLGAHLLSEEILLKASTIILLSSFSRFIPKVGETRALKAGLKGMKKALGTKNEKQMLNNFFQKACYPSSMNNMPYNLIMDGLKEEGREKLFKDLDLLIKTNSLPKGFPKTAKALVIDSPEDLILLPNTKSTLIKDLNSHLIQPITHWSIPEAGHALLKTNIKKDVLNWLESCI